VRVDEFLETHLGLPLQHLDLNGIFTDPVDLVVDFRLKLPQNINRMIKTLVILEDIGRTLDPGFQMIDRIRPFAGNYFLRRYAPSSLWERVAVTALDTEGLLGELPVHARRLLSDLAKGKARITMGPAGLGTLRFVLDAVSNRLVFGLILAALLVSSSLIVLAGIAPRWHGIPVVGLGGYVAAAVMGFGFAIDRLRIAARQRRRSRRRR
jgi:ubiquinone biosynthesis protein